MYTTNASVGMKKWALNKGNEINDKQTEQTKTTDYKYPPDYMFVCFT